MRLIQVVWDYIQGTLLTTKGDLVKRGAAVNERLGVGTAKKVLGVNDAGDDLEYRYGIEIATAKGDLIKRGTTACTRFPIGNVYETIRVNAPGDNLEYADGIDIATIKGDLIKRGAAACARLGIGAANQVLAVNVAGDDLEYRDKIALPLGGEFIGYNGGQVTVTAGGDDIATVDLGTVTLNSIILITTYIDGLKGGTGGTCQFTLIKDSGTAIITFLSGEVELRTRRIVDANDTWEYQCTVFGKITTSGTLVLLLKGLSQGSNIVIGATDGRIHTITLKT